MRFRLSLAVCLCACNARLEETLPPNDSVWSSLAERPCPEHSDLTYENFGEPFFLGWCTGCHSSLLLGEARAGAPVGVDFDSLDAIRTRADEIWTRAGDQNVAMPPAGGPSLSVREELGAWLACGAPAATTPGADDAGVDLDPPDGGQAPSDGGAPLGPPLFSDTGEYATPITDNMAFCGPTSCDPSSSSCCIGENGPQCSTEPADCDFLIGCDGPEDCPGRACCLMPSASSVEIMCAASCDMMPTICHTAAQCPDAQPMCCSGGSPFGHCTTMEGAAPGERCDVR